MDNNFGILVREYEPQDKNFIYASFLRGLYYGDSWFSLIPKEVFMQGYHRILDALFDKNDTEIKIACVENDTDIILGYCIYKTLSEGTVLHYVFVKNAWRKNGIAKKLVPNNVIAVTHLTKIGKALKPANVDFNPFLI